MYDNQDFVNTRELKNKTNEILRQAEKGKTVVVTRHGKPVALIVPFPAGDTGKKPGATLYARIREALEKKYPDLLDMGREELLAHNDDISSKVQGYASWKDMDRAAKGDPHGFSGQ